MFNHVTIFLPYHWLTFSLCQCHVTDQLCIYVYAILLVNYVSMSMPCHWWTTLHVCLYVYALLLINYVSMFVPCYWLTMSICLCYFWLPMFLSLSYVCAKSGQVFDLLLVPCKPRPPVSWSASDGVSWSQGFINFGLVPGAALDSALALGDTCMKGRRILK